MHSSTSLPNTEKTQHREGVAEEAHPDDLEKSPDEFVEPILSLDRVAPEGIQRSCKNKCCGFAAERDTSLKNTPAAKEPSPCALSTNTRQPGVWPIQQAANLEAD